MDPKEFVCKLCGSVRESDAKLKIHHKVVHEDVDYRSCTVYTSPTRPDIETEMLKHQLEMIDAEEAIQAAIRANYKEFTERHGS